MVVLRALIQLTRGITGQMRQLNKSIWNFRFVKTLEAATACGEGNGERQRSDKKMMYFPRLARPV